MRLPEILRLVFMNIKQNKFKVFLTSLGIIVGTATIVMVIAIGEGGKQDVAEQFKNLNAGTITVSSNGLMTGGMSMGGGEMRAARGTTGAPSGTSSAARSSGGGSSGTSNVAASLAMMSAMSNATLSIDQLDDVLFFVPNIVTGAISASVSQSVYGGDLEDATSYTVVGTQPSYQQISNLSLAIGSFLTDEELEMTTRCVVLGSTIATEMFGSAMLAYDSKIDIDGRTYVVNGVLSPMGTVVSGVNPDTTIFTPYTTAEKYMFERTYSPQLSILASDVSEVATVISNISAVLTQNMPNVSFSITDAGATMDAAMESATTLSTLLMAVAVIVFIVGGIGIMNVLFVSVKERTREIGVLKAIGTKKRDILLLFILEANSIGMLGGCFGILLSLGLLPLVEKTDMTVIITMQAVVLAFAFAVVTGTLFGFYPALKASNLIPIQALNNE